MSTGKRIGAATAAKAMAGATMIVVVFFACVRPVAAKGPESVTISGPGIEEPLELMSDDNWVLISKLMERTGLWYATGDLPRPIDGPTGYLGPAYTLTWINGGPPGKSVEERTLIQYLYLHAENGPLIHTPRQENLDNWGQDRIGWFTAPDRLRGTLEELGVSLSDAPASGPLPAGALRAVAGLGVVIVVGIGLRRRGLATKNQLATQSA